MDALAEHVTQYHVIPYGNGTLNVPVFANHFREHINRTVQSDDDYSTSGETIRVFHAMDYACEKQPSCFSPFGESYYHGHKSPQNTKEFLCDYVFINRHHQVILALESEWGKYGSASATFDAVIYDYRKIINMAAPIKIMVFAYNGNDNKIAILEVMKELNHSWPTVQLGTLIVIACPWDDEMNADTMDVYQWLHHDWCLIEKV